MSVLVTLYRGQAFNNSNIRTVAACREALTEARYEAEQRENEIVTDGEATGVVKVRERRNAQNKPLKPQPDFIPTGSGYAALHRCKLFFVRGWN